LIYLLDIRCRLRIREGDIVRGIIMAHEIGEDLKRLVTEHGKGLPKINLKEYMITSGGIDVKDVTPQSQV